MSFGSIIGAGLGAVVLASSDLIGEFSAPPNPGAAARRAKERDVSRIDAAKAAAVNTETRQQRRARERQEAKRYPDD